MEKIKPLFSIILPIYNTEKYLIRCLDSIHAQTYPDYEVLMINDGSTDSSSEICQQYQQKDCRFHLLSQENHGVSAARNHGLKFAQGKYILFVDSDDKVTTNFVRDFANELEKSCVDLVICNYYECLLDHNQNNTKAYDFGEVSVETYMKKMARNPIANYYGVLWNKAFRHDVIDRWNLQFDTSLSFGEDFKFLMEYLEKIQVLRTIKSYNYYYTYDRKESLGKGNPDPYVYADQIAETYVSYKKLWEVKKMYWNHKKLVQYFGARMYFERLNAQVLRDDEYENYLSQKCLRDNGYTNADIRFFKWMRKMKKFCKNICKVVIRK